MKFAIVALILFPCFAFGQTAKDDYAIYSQYLKVFQAKNKGEKIYFVVRESTDYDRKHDIDSDLNDILDDLKGCLKGNRDSNSDIYVMFRDFAPTLIKDTLWMNLIADLNRKMNRKFEIKNNFSSDLQTVLINDDGYKKYFGHFKRYKQIERKWARFHTKYRMPSALIELSEIVSDGQRAVFYFSWRCGGLCGDGDLVFFGKENNEWKYLASSPIWYN